MTSSSRMVGAALERRPISEVIARGLAASAQNSWDSIVAADGAASCSTGARPRASAQRAHGHTVTAAERAHHGSDSRRAPGWLSRTTGRCLRPASRRHARCQRTTRHTAPLELWAGFECTLNRVGSAQHDQLALLRHYVRRDDIDRLAALGVRTVRYPMLWERIERGEPDGRPWEWTDQRWPRCAPSGSTPIVGLVHHGSGPIGTSLLDDEFPERFAAFARVRRRALSVGHAATRRSTSR